MKPNSKTGIISNNFCFILFPCLSINIIFFGLTKNGRHNRSSGVNARLLGRVGATLAAGVIGHLDTMDLQWIHYVF